MPVNPYLTDGFLSGIERGMRITGALEDRKRQKRADERAEELFGLEKEAKGLQIEAGKLKLKDLKKKAKDEETLDFLMKVNNAGDRGALAIYLAANPDIKTNVDNFMESVLSDEPKEFDPVKLKETLNLALKPEMRSRIGQEFTKDSVLVKNGVVKAGDKIKSAEFNGFRQDPNDPGRNIISLKLTTEDGVVVDAPVTPGQDNTGAANVLVVEDGQLGRAMSTLMTAVEDPSVQQIAQNFQGAGFDDIGLQLKREIYSRNGGDLSKTLSYDENVAIQALDSKNKRDDKRTKQLIDIVTSLTKNPEIAAMYGESLNRALTGLGLLDTPVASFSFDPETGQLVPSGGVVNPQTPTSEQPQGDQGEGFFSKILSFFDGSDKAEIESAVTGKPNEELRQKPEYYDAMAGQYGLLSREEFDNRKDSGRSRGVTRTYEDYVKNTLPPAAIAQGLKERVYDPIVQGYDAAVTASAQGEEALRLGATDLIEAGAGELALTGVPTQSTGGRTVRPEAPTPPPTQDPVVAKAQQYLEQLKAESNRLGSSGVIQQGRVKQGVDEEIRRLASDIQAYSTKSLQNPSSKTFSRIISGGN